MIVLGVDGCRGGWIGASTAVDPGRAGLTPRFAFRLDDTLVWHSDGVKPWLSF